MGKTIHKLINEVEIFAKFAVGDEKAFEIIYHHYNRRLVPFVQKMIRSDELAQEIIQDIFVHLWINRHLLADVQHPTAYLFNIAANKTLNHIKKVARDSNLMDKVALQYNDESNETEERIQLKECKEMINMAVSKLPGQRWLIWEMSRNQGLTHEQIAERMNISKNTVKNQMVSALKFVKSYMEERGGMVGFITFVILIGK